MLDANLLAAIRSRELAGEIKRVGFTIPERVVKALNKATLQREKSRFVTEAIVEKIQKEQNKKRYKILLAEYAKSAKTDAKIAEEWFTLEEAAYLNYEKTGKSKRPKAK